MLRATAGCGVLGAFAVRRFLPQPGKTMKPIASATTKIDLRPDCRHDAAADNGGDESSCRRTRSVGVSVSRGFINSPKHSAQMLLRKGRGRTFTRVKQNPLLRFSPSRDALSIPETISRNFLLDFS
jgi:hypothetical protein